MLQQLAIHLDNAVSGLAFSWEEVLHNLAEEQAQASCSDRLHELLG